MASQLYGTTWHLEAALVMAGAALAVLGVPNAGKPGGAVQAVAVPSNVTVQPADRPAGGM